MIVTVQIAGGFRYHISNVDQLVEGVDCEVQIGSTVRDVLEQLHFPRNISSTIFLNGHVALMDTTLTDKDRIYLATPMVGG